ncbi:MAG: NAD-dependent epimerase/dehydratase family protein [Nitrosopumilaceae archaeon]
MKIIITGGTGFIGSSLAERLLKENHEVILLVRSDKKNSNIANFANKVTIEHCDVTDEKLINEIISRISPDAIFHFAGQLTTYESFENPLYDVDVNSKSTIIILEAVRKLKNNCRFLLGSTFWVVGRPEKLPVTEKDCCHPRNIYAADRLASENYCSIYNIVYGLDTIVLRFTNTYGEKEQYLDPKKAALNYLLYKAFKGEDVPIYNNGKFFRDYIHVTDVVSACKIILEKGKSAETYFVGSGIRTWFYEIAKIIEKLTSAKIVYVDAPPYHKKIDVGNFVVDNSKLRGLGWQPEMNIKDGIKSILDYFKTVDIKQ